MSDIDIRPARFDDPAARALVAAAMRDMVARYGSSDGTPLETSDFDSPQGCFFVGWRDGGPVGCGGWRRLSRSDDAGESVAEVKRMYVLPHARRTGVAAALLLAIEDSAREGGLHRIVLETGARQPEAIEFYTARGYQRVPDYGHYRTASGVRSFGRDL